jgi:hypothetical protein
MQVELGSLFTYKLYNNTTMIRKQTKASFINKVIQIKRRLNCLPVPRVRVETFSNIKICLVEKLHKKELHTLYSPRNTVRMIEFKEDEMDGTY